MTKRIITKIGDIFCVEVDNDGITGSVLVIILL